MRNGRIIPVSPITRKETPINIMVDQERSSIAPMRVKFVSLRILNAIAADAPCARKKVSAAKICRKISHRTKRLTIVISFVKGKRSHAWVYAHGAASRLPDPVHFYYYTTRFSLLQQCGFYHEKGAG